MIGSRRLTASARLGCSATRAWLLLVVPYQHAWLVVTAVALLALVLALRSAELAHALPRASLLVLGVIYVFGCWRCAIVLRGFGPHWLMYALLVSWTGDIGAYYIGRAFGRHRLGRSRQPEEILGRRGGFGGDFGAAGGRLPGAFRPWRQHRRGGAADRVGKRGGPTRRPGGIRHETRRGSERLWRACCPATAVSWTAWTARYL